VQIREVLLVWKYYMGVNNVKRSVFMAFIAGKLKWANASYVSIVHCISDYQ
jgi:hypothetical protein